MISTIFIDTKNERLFPMAGNTREAITDFIRNQIDLSFAALCRPETVRYLQPALTPDLVDAIISNLLGIAAERRKDLGSFEVCADEIFLYLLEKRDFVVAGWADIFRETTLPDTFKGKKVIHSFGHAIEKEFRSACMLVASPEPLERNISAL
ncbi:MAG TPA: hypothetical protein VD816_11015 [Ohtaekwangia sp.]|nr:hypothetical protein [Ohtaekwangia sp.]